MEKYHAGRLMSPQLVYQCHCTWGLLLGPVKGVTGQDKQWEPIHAGSHSSDPRNAW
jgi:hypothetical protein